MRECTQRRESLVTQSAIHSTWSWVTVIEVVSDRVQEVVRGSGVEVWRGLRIENIELVCFPGFYGV